MLKKSCGIFLLVASGAVFASPWYATVGTGYAWSQKVGTTNPDPTYWDNANEGYDNKIGNEPFYTLGLGLAVTDYLNTDLSFTSFSKFNYQKYQTGSSDTPGFSGNTRTRYYDLDNQNLLINFTLHPYSQRFILQIKQMNLIPFIGFGAGLGINTVSNFHTVNSSGANTSIGDTKTTNAFAWQGSLGVTLHPNDSKMFCDLGYRYYDGGKYKAPGSAAANVAPYNGAILTGASWEGHLKTNEAFANIRFMF